MRKEQLNRQAYRSVFKIEQKRIETQVILCGEEMDDDQ